VVAVLAGLSAGLAGCYDNSQVQAFLRKPREPIPGVEYRVLPPDVLHVTSIHVPEINDVIQQIRPDGKINLPLVGEIYVVWKTPKEIEEEINLAAGRYYGQVDCTVRVAQFNSQKIFIFGQVFRAGPVPFTGHDTLLDALCYAKPTELAAPEHIVVVRGSGPAEGGQGDIPPSAKYKTTGVRPERADCPPHKLEINLYAMIKDGDMSNNILLQSGDVIYVRPNVLAAIGLAVQQLLFPVRPAVETVTTPAAVTAGGGL
jgi:polysaccharide export outer membrane protein